MGGIELQELARRGQLLVVELRRLFPQIPKKRFEAIVHEHLLQGMFDAQSVKLCDFDEYVNQSARKVLKALQQELN